MSIAAVALQKVLDMEAVWEIYGTGEISVKMQVKKDREFPQLPRFGIRMFLKGEYENLEILWDWDRNEVTGINAVPAAMDCMIQR